MSIDRMIEVIKMNKECVLHAQEMGCNARCQNCYNHVVDYLAIDAYNEILKILEEKKINDTHCDSKRNSV